LGFISIFMFSIFPTILPNWMPFVIWWVASVLWIYTSFQLRYPIKRRNRWCFALLFILISFSISLLNTTLFLKQFLFPIIPWSVAFTPMYISVFLATIAIMKLNFSMNNSSFCLNATIWNLGYLCLTTISVIGSILILLKLDGIIPVPYVILMLPFHLIGFILNIYYYVKAFTNWIPRSVYKNPLTVFRGASLNTLEMNQFII
jgi:hypothetical protein